MRKLYSLSRRSLAVGFAVILAVFGSSSVAQAQSSEKQLLTFSFTKANNPSLVVDAVGVVNQTNFTVAVTVPNSTNLTTLIATFTQSANATVSVGATPQVTNVTVNDFTNTVTYKVTAQNGSFRNYYVTVTKAAAVSDKVLTSFVFEAFTPDIVGVINQSNHTVAVTVPFSTDVTTLVASFTSSDLSSVKVGATVQVSGTTVNDFTAAVVYTVVAEDASTQDYTVTVTKAAASTQKDISSFGFTNLATTAVGVIDQVGQTIDVEIPFGADITTLVATYTNSVLSTVTVGGVPQVNGTTPNDFTAPVIYMVTAEDGGTKAYTVTVTKAPASQDNQILTFGFTAALNASLTADVAGVINETAKTITVTVPWATDVTALISTFTNSALSTVLIGAVPQVSGTTANNFTNPVLYICKAEDASEEIYTVTVNKVPVSIANQILTFNFIEGIEPDVIGVVNETAKTIALTVPFSTNVTALVATFTQSPYATVWIGVTQQVSGTTANDFTAPVAYICQAQDGSQEIYTVTVTKAPASAAKSLLTFSFEALTPPVVGVINQVAKTVTVLVPSSTDVTTLVATFTSSPLSNVTVAAAAQTSGTTVNDFTNPVVYKVIAEDLTEDDYVVTVTKAPASSAKSITAFSFEALVPPVDGVIDQVSKTIALLVPFGTNVTNLVATFTASNLAVVKVGATPQVSGTTPNNFTAPVVYVVTAEDGSIQNYTVTVTIAAVNTEKALTAFSFQAADNASLASNVHGVINETNKTVALNVPYTTNVTALIATFTSSNFSTVSIAAAPQVSGTTPNDFTTPLTYTVTAQDGTTQDYIVTVTIVEMTKQFVTYTFTGTVTIGGDLVDWSAVGTINNTTRSIQVNVPSSVDRSSLAANFTLTPNTTAYIGLTQQVSGTTLNNHTTVLTYTLLATDGTTTTYQVTVINNPVSSSALITSFSLKDFNPDVVAVVDHAAGTIIGQIPNGSSLTNLVATFTNSTMARVKIGAVRQVSGTTANNFTNPVTYTCLAEDGTTKDYVVTITVAPASSAKDLLTFKFEAALNAALSADVVGVVNQGAQTVQVTVPAGTDKTQLVASYTTSPLTLVRVRNLGIQASGLTINNFTSPLVYEVYAQDGSMKDYLVTVKEADDGLPPVVSNAVQNVTNSTGSFVLVQSNESTGKVYIILAGVAQASIANLEAAVAAGNGRASFVSAANTDIAISTANMKAGVYYAYAIDGTSNMSAKGTNAITITDSQAPQVFVAAQTISNAPNNIVSIRSTDDFGFVYLIMEGVPQASKGQLDAAVLSNRGSKALVTAANTDVPVALAGLTAGNYHAYAVDVAGNLSDPSANIVVITQASRMASILSFSFNQLNPPAVGQIIGTSISVIVPVGTNLSNLVASFTISPLATAFVGLVQQVSGVTPNDFAGGEGLMYVVEAEDGSTVEYTVRVFFNTGIDNLEWFDQVKVYPNPFTNKLSIEAPVPADRIEVINVMGQTMIQIEEPMSNMTSIETASWNNGLYLIRFYRKGQLVGTEKVLK